MTTPKEPSLLYFVESKCGATLGVWIHFKCAQDAAEWWGILTGAFDAIVTDQWGNVWEYDINYPLVYPEWSGGVRAQLVGIVRAQSVSIVERAT